MQNLTEMRRFTIVDRRGEKKSNLQEKKPFNIPENSRAVPAQSGGDLVFIIKDENVGKHEAAAGLDKPVVLAQVSFCHGGHEPGDHDGIRDGYLAPRMEYKRIYCSLADWLAAGNPHPDDL